MGGIYVTPTGVPDRIRSGLPLCQRWYGSRRQHGDEKDFGVGDEHASPRAGRTFRVLVVVQCEKFLLADTPAGPGVDGENA